MCKTVIRQIEVQCVAGKESHQKKTVEICHVKHVLLSHARTRALAPPARTRALELSHARTRALAPPTVFIHSKIFV